MHEARDKKSPKVPQQNTESFSIEMYRSWHWNWVSIHMRTHSAQEYLYWPQVTHTACIQKWNENLLAGIIMHLARHIFATLLLPLSLSFVSSSSCWRISSLLLSLTIRATITNTDERTEIEKRKKFGQIYASLDGTKADCAISILSTNFAGSIFFAFVYISVNHAVSIGIRPRYFH